MMQNEQLPKNVLCSLADCGYTSPKGERYYRELMKFEDAHGLLKPEYKL